MTEQHDGIVGGRIRSVKRNLKSGGSFEMDPGGIEPPSQEPEAGASTRVGDDLILTPLRASSPSDPGVQSHVFSEFLLGTPLKLHAESFTSHKDVSVSP